MWFVTRDISEVDVGDAAAYGEMSVCLNLFQKL